MRPENIIVPVQACSLSELNEADLELVEAARLATRGSYAPYSHFQVGAAIRMASGTIVRGANQENAAFSSGTCAERSACFAAGANYPDEPMEAIAIAACTQGAFQRTPVSPCGACRQALLEYEHKQGKPMRVILYGEDECYLLPSVASLLPLSFTDF